MNQKTQKLPGCHTKGAFFWVHPKPELSSSFQNLS
jgi:hypothetical protein